VRSPGFTTAPRTRGRLSFYRLFPWLSFSRRLVEAWVVIRLARANGAFRARAKTVTAARSLWQQPAASRLRARVRDAGSLPADGRKSGGRESSLLRSIRAGASGCYSCSGKGRWGWTRGRTEARETHARERGGENLDAHGALQSQAVRRVAFVRLGGRRTCLSLLSPSRRWATGRTASSASATLRRSSTFRTTSMRW